MTNSKGIIGYLILLILFSLVAWKILTHPRPRNVLAIADSRDMPIVPAQPTTESGSHSAPGSLSYFVDAFTRPFPLLLCQLAVIIAAAGLLGSLGRKLGQPSVIGEMAAGIILGPTLLGHILPGLESRLFPAPSFGHLNLLSQVGIILFMFAVGMEIDLGSLRKHAKIAVFVSHVGILLPFLMGMVAAILLFGKYSPDGSRFPAFALFMGIAMSITAFPVLARILEERGLSATELGTTAMASAAIDDVSAWTLLALVLALARAQSSSAVLVMAALAIAFTMAMIFLMRPLAARLAIRYGHISNPGRGTASLALIFVFLSSLATEAIGIHSLFGAFLAGIIMPSTPGFRKFLRERLEYAASLFLLPVFFAATGLRTDMRIMRSPSDWCAFAGVLGLAVAGKLGGVAMAARFTGASWRKALALGALMNTRGLMELIVLNIGLDLGILSQRIFTLMVLMALVTTAMTGPMLTMLGIGKTVTEKARPVAIPGIR